MCCILPYKGADWSTCPHLRSHWSIKIPGESDVTWVTRGLFVYFLNWLLPPPVWAWLLSQPPDSDILKLINSCWALSRPGCHDVNYANHKTHVRVKTSPLSSQWAYCNYNLMCTNIATVSLMESVMVVIIRCHVTLCLLHCHGDCHASCQARSYKDTKTA